MIADIFIDRKALDAEIDRLTRGHLKAAGIAIDETTRDYEKRLEAATRSVSKGNLWRAWASDVQPRKGRIAREPAGFIYVNGRTRTRSAIDYLTKSGRVAASDGGPVAIPLPAAGPRNRGNNFMLTPDEWQRRTGVTLRLLARPGKPALLVADGTLNARSGTYRKITRQRTAADERRGFVRGQTTIPIFILLNPRDFRARFSIAQVMAGAGADLATAFVRAAAKIP